MARRLEELVFYTASNFVRWLIVVLLIVAQDEYRDRQSLAPRLQHLAILMGLRLQRHELPLRDRRY